MAETRRRIVDAAVHLHTSLGPGRTSVSAIAERAGVQRHTVYAHFPSERELFRACSAHWDGLHPFPDVSRWLGEEEPDARLRRALGDLYAWYEEVEVDLALFARDADVLGEVAAENEAARRELADLLSRGLPRRKAVRAAVGHALAFETWRSLVRREGLSRAQAVDAMVRLVASV
jgi:AcrR family transcriptional regulator